MKLKEQMINCQAEFQDGLEKGVALCLKMINESLNTQYDSFGVALAHIYQMKTNLESKTDWK